MNRMIALRTLLCLCLLADSAVAEDVRVLTFNIRYENSGDGLDGWANRRQAVAKVIEGADLAGLQEVKPGQRAWLRERLPEFELVGIGREKDDTDESAPVVFRKERFALVEAGTFWLSETPEVVASKSWDSSLPRVCSWATLRDRRDGQTVSFFNVHLDHRGAVSRDKALALVLERMAKATNPVILTGDFNATVNEAPLRRVMGSEKPLLVSSTVALGQPDEGTFHGFAGKAGAAAIDFIFGEKERVKFSARAILRTTYAGADGAQRYVSDHFPVSAVVSVSGGR